MDPRILVILFSSVTLFLCSVAFGLTGTCNTCSDCSAKLNGDYEVVMLTADIIDYAGDCIVFDASNIEFDCQGHLIDGTGGITKGVHLSHENNTVKNCEITGFSMGILWDITPKTASWRRTTFRATAKASICRIQTTTTSLETWSTRPIMEST